MAKQDTEEIDGWTLTYGATGDGTAHPRSVVAERAGYRIETAGAPDDETVTRAWLRQIVTSRAAEIDAAIADGRLPAAYDGVKRRLEG